MYLKITYHHDSPVLSIEFHFRKFLVHSTDYEDTIALKLLSEAGIEEILFDYAMVSLLSDTVSGAQYRLQGHSSSETAL